LGFLYELPQSDHDELVVLAEILGGNEIGWYVWESC